MIYLGSDWVGGETRDTPVGTVLEWVHYPQGAIQYDEIVVDDELVGVAYVCYDDVQDILSWFEPLSDATSVETRYRSSPMVFVQQGCQIVFRVRNSAGETAGLRFKAHCPECLH